MKKKAVFIVIAVVLLTAITVLKKTSNKQEYITVFMASSTTDLIQELAELYTKNTGVKVKLSPASSGVLAKQITNGAEADIYISASKKWIDYLVEETVATDVFVENRLVLVTPINGGVEFKHGQNLPVILKGKLSIGDPEHVPAGAYAKEVLEYYGWYKTLEPRLLTGANVRAALSVVEMGESDLGIVYKTDALKSQKVKILETFPLESHSNIVYYCGLLNSNIEAASFYNFLLEDLEAEELFGTYGFN